jgi:hypothetical protein
MFDFSAGLNLMAPSDNMAPNELQVAENIELYNRGGFGRRSGIVQHAEVTGATKLDLYMEFEYLDPEGVSHLSKLVFYDGVLRDITRGVELATGLGSHLAYEIYKYKLYLMNGTRFMEYDGTALKDVTCTEADSNLAKIKKCRYIAQRGVRLFATGNPAEPTVLYYTETGRPEYWRVLNVVETVTDDGDINTGLKEFHGALVVFKTRSIFAWFGYDPNNDVEFHQIPCHTGCRAYRTICNVGNAVWFLGDGGVYALVGTYKDVISTAQVSQKITPLFESIKHGSTLGQSSASAVYYKDRYYLSIATEEPGVNNVVYVLYGDRVDDNGVAPGVVYTGWSIACWWHSLVDDELYSGSSVSGIVHHHDTNCWTDLGEPIPVRVRTAPIESVIGEYIRMKKYKRGYAILRQFETYDSEATINCTIDYHTISTVVDPDESLIWDMRDWDVSRWGFIDVVTRRFRIGKKGKRLTVEIADDSAERLEFYGFGCEYKIKKPERR